MRNPSSSMWKAVILIGGPDKGTRFRPLSLDVPKPLFPVAGMPMIQHHIESCAQVPEIKEIILIGFFNNDDLKGFVEMMNDKYSQSLIIKYLPEYAPLGTAGGLYHFRDQILSGSPESIFVFNSDVCCNFQLKDVLCFHQRKAVGDCLTIVATEATHQESMSYGCLVEDPGTNEVTHYVEKPETFVSSLINCGLYVFSPGILKNFMADIFQQHQTDRLENGNGDNNGAEKMWLETEILSQYAGSGKMFVFKSKKVWGQIKSAASAIHANKLYLQGFHETHPDRLAEKRPEGPVIRGDVFIHKTADVDPSAVLGPNVTVGENVRIGVGVRVFNSIILSGAVLKDHCCILNSIIGWKCAIGAWSRVEGTASQPDPNAPFSKIVSGGLFNDEGKLIPAITVLGRDVIVGPEMVVLNSIVLPNKKLNQNSKNQIIL